MLKLTKRELAQYKLLTDVILPLAEGKGTRGFAREIAEEVARDAGKPSDSLRPIIPWQVFSRTLTVSGTSGATVGTDVGDVADVLRAASVVTRAGAQVLPNLTGNMIAARVNGSATGYWLTNETTNVTSTDPTFAAKTMAPKTCGALTSFSRQLALQVEQFEPVIRRHLLRLIGSTMDAGVLNGSGSNGEPQGLLNATGVQTQSGTTLAHAGVVNMREQCVTNGADDDAVVFLAVPTVAEILQKRDVGTDTGVFVWNGDQVAGRRAYATTSMPAQAMVAGDFATVLVGIFGPGPEIEADPSTYFQSGIVQMRCLLSMDVAIQAPAAFCKSTSIT